jgi:ATP-dependent Clp protease ATP-binding subunit ClpC
MFERFTQSARRTVVAAQEEARVRGSRGLDSVHLLLGLRHVSGDFGPQVLASLGAPIEGVCDRASAGLKVHRKKPEGHLAFTDGAKDVIRRSVEEALALGHEHVGTEHLLCALLARPEGAAYAALAAAGIEHDPYLRAVLAGYERAAPPAVAPAPFSPAWTPPAGTGTAGAAIPPPAPEPDPPPPEPAAPSPDAGDDRDEPDPWAPSD